MIGHSFVGLVEPKFLYFFLYEYFLEGVDRMEHVVAGHKTLLSLFVALLMQIKIFLMNAIYKPSRRQYTINSPNGQANNRFGLHALPNRRVEYHLSDRFHDETDIEQGQGEHDKIPRYFMS